MIILVQQLQDGTLEVGTCGDTGGQVDTVPLREHPAPRVVWDKHGTTRPYDGGVVRSWTAKISST